MYTKKYLELELKLKVGLKGYISKTISRDDLQTMLESVTLETQTICLAIKESAQKAGPKFSYPAGAIDCHNLRSKAGNILNVLLENNEPALQSMIMLHLAGESLEGYFSTLRLCHPGITFLVEHEAETTTEIHIAKRDGRFDPRVESDALNLLHNLLQNAVRYTPEGGEIVIRFEGEGQVSVRNTRTPDSKPLTNTTLFGLDATESGEESKKEEELDPSAALTSGIGTQASLAALEGLVELVVDEVASTSTHTVIRASFARTEVFEKLQATKAFEPKTPYIAVVDDDLTIGLMLTREAKKIQISGGSISLRIFESHEALKDYAKAEGNPVAVLSDDQGCNGLSHLKDHWKAECGLSKVAVMSGDDISEEKRDGIAFYNKTNIKKALLDAIQAFGYEVEPIKRVKKQRPPKPSSSPGSTTPRELITIRRNASSTSIGGRTPGPSPIANGAGAGSSTTPFGDAARVATPPRLMPSKEGESEVPI